MALPEDLLRVAASLAKLEPGKPRQASLRRAVSTAYYALFHALVGAAADRMLVNDASRRAYGAQARRSFTHRGVRDLAESVTRAPGNRGRLGRVLTVATPDPRLVAVGRALALLYEERERADYDASARNRRADAEALVRHADRALRAWQQARGTPDAEAFLVALTLYGRAAI